jgi:hypothetical protein
MKICLARTKENGNEPRILALCIILTTDRNLCASEYKNGQHTNGININKHAFIHHTTTPQVTSSGNTQRRV